MIALAYDGVSLFFFFQGPCSRLQTYPRLVETEIRHDCDHSMLLDIEVMVRVDWDFTTKDADFHDWQCLCKEASNRVTDQLSHEGRDGHTGIPHGEELVHARTKLRILSGNSLDHAMNIVLTSVKTTPKNHILSVFTGNVGSSVFGTLALTSR